jgi:uncharacterized protein involved in type VI secretion and phage assembly
MQAQSIFSILQASFSSASRLYDLSIEGLQEAAPAHSVSSGFLPGQTFMVEAWCGAEALHGTSQWDLLVLSMDAHISLASLLGKVCQLHTALADGTRATRSGLINEVELRGSEGGLARYRLKVVDWTWMMSQSVASRVWQDKALLDIVGSIFKRYTPQAAWRVSEEVGPFLAQAHQGSVRSYSVQYRQSDLAFVSRLLADAGLSWRIEEDKDSPAKHRLVIFADSSASAVCPAPSSRCSAPTTRPNKASAPAPQLALSTAASKRPGWKATTPARPTAWPTASRPRGAPSCSSKPSKPAISAGLPAAPYARCAPERALP